MGPFNNETRRFEKSPGYEEGHWYLNDDRQLYIVPNAEAEIEGPDDELLTQLNAVYRATEFEQVDPYQVANLLGLEFVVAPLRRFDEEVGFFYA